MSTQANLQEDPFEKLKKILEDAPRGYNFLDGYVRKLEHNRHEEEIFIDLAFKDANDSGAGTGPYIVSPISQLYEPLDAERKLEVRRWWHEMVRGEAKQFPYLKTRLSKLT